MARANNPYYSGPYPTDPAWGMIGSNLATALFGDPEAQAAAQLNRARIRQANASAGYDEARTTGENLTIENRRRLTPDTFINIMRPPENAYEAPTDIGLPGVVLGQTPPSPTPMRPATAASQIPQSDLVRAMVPITAMTESRNRDYDDRGRVVTSPAGAKGRMQVMDATNRDPGYGVRPAANDSLEERARVGRDYIAALTRHYGDPAKAWAAYNWGPGNLDGAIRRFGQDWMNDPTMPQETRDYVARNVGQLGGGSSLASAVVPTASPIMGNVTPPAYAAEPAGQSVDPIGLAQAVSALVLGGYDPGEAIAAMTGYLGDDRAARGALISQGSSPSETFAATRERADNIAARDQYGSLAEAIGKANIDNSTDVFTNTQDVAQDNINNVRDNERAIQQTNIEEAGKDRRGDKALAKQKLVNPPGPVDFNNEIRRQMGVGKDEDGNWLADPISGDAMKWWRSLATDEWQKDRNMTAAVQRARAAMMRVSQGGDQSPATEETKAIGGKTYVKRGGQWYEQ